MYYTLLALFFKVGIKCENHTAAIMLLKDVFEIKNKDIYFAKKERVDKQYYVDFKVTEKEVITSIEIAEDFDKKLFDFIESLNNDKIENFRKKIKMILEKNK